MADAQGKDAELSQTPGFSIVKRANSAQFTARKGQSLDYFIERILHYDKLVFAPFCLTFSEPENRGLPAAGQHREKQGLSHIRGMHPKRRFRDAESGENAQ